MQNLTAPIWIYGLGGSGTSLLKNLLDGHPDLYAIPPNEFDLFRNTPAPLLALGQSSQAYKAKGALATYRTDDIAVLKREYMTHTYLWGLPDARMVDFSTDDRFDSELYLQELRDAETRNVRDLYTATVRVMARATRTLDTAPDARVVCKATHRAERVPETLDLWPDAKFIYMIRNPYAWIVSRRRNIRRATGRWPQYPVLVRAARASYYWAEKWARLMPDRFKIFRYEDLARAPDAVMTEIAVFLDIRWSPRLMEQTVLGVPHRGHTAHGDGLQPTTVSPAKLDAWRGHITGYEVQLINNYFDLVLRDYRYEPHPQKGGPIDWWAPHWREGGVVRYLANRLLLLGVLG